MLIWVVLLVGGTLVGGAEIGHRLGARTRGRFTAETIGQLTTLHAALLGVYGLLLGFTFAMAVSRFDDRKKVLLEESNGIGTTYLRLDLLDEPARTEARQLIRRYVDVRIAFHDARLRSREAAKDEREAEQLQRRLWSIITTAARSPTGSRALPWLLESANEMIDFDATRLASLENHVPPMILVLLFVVGVAASTATGFVAAMSGHRLVFATLMIPLLLAAVEIVIVDLDRPRIGLIKVSQDALLRLRDAL